MFFGKQEIIDELRKKNRMLETSNDFLTFEVNKLREDVAFYQKTLIEVNANYAQLKNELKSYKDNEKVSKCSIGLQCELCKNGVVEHQQNPDGSTGTTTCCTLTQPCANFERKHD